MALKIQLLECRLIVESFRLARLTRILVLTLMSQ